MSTQLEELTEIVLAILTRVEHLESEVFPDDVPEDVASLGDARRAFLAKTTKEKR